MTQHYSKTTKGFYDTAIHGALTMPSEQDPEVMVPNPACLIPSDAVEITSALYHAMMAGQAAGQRIVGDVNGLPILVDAPAPSDAELQRMLTAAVQIHLDTRAKAMGYDDIKTAVTYADEPAVAKFEAEGRALRAWRSQVWNACIVKLSAVTAGTSAVPTANELIASLPVFTAP